MNPFDVCSIGAEFYILFFQDYYPPKRWSLNSFIGSISIIYYFHHQGKYSKREEERYKRKLHINLEFHSFIKKALQHNTNSFRFLSNLNLIIRNSMNGEFSVNHFYIKLSQASLGSFSCSNSSICFLHSGLLKQSVMVFLRSYFVEDSINPFNFYAHFC